MNNEKESKWSELERAEALLKETQQNGTSIFKIPDQIKLKHTSGFFFGLLMGIGFCLGFIISLLILLGIISFFVYSKFPQLFT